MLSLEGIVEDIIFRNEDNGYTVARLNSSDGPIVIVGSTPFINLEENVRLEGEMVYHKEYGDQFAFKTLEPIMPSSLKGIENYLGSGLIPNIGKKTAKRIVDRFGLESLDIIQYNPEKLKEVKGIGEKKLEGILEAFNDQREMRDTMVFLQEYGISVKQGIKIYKRYGVETINIVRENPYRLSRDVYGIGFKMADKIAREMGIEKTSPYRIEAGLRHTILEASNDGHSYLPKEVLIDETTRKLDLAEDLVESGLRELLIRGTLVQIMEGEEFRIYYSPLHLAENAVAGKLIELSQRPKDYEVDLDKEIERVEAEDGISFAKNQKLAIKQGLSQGFVVITGGPGTGKTTIIKGIIKICEDLGQKVLLTAPTGRAAKRMQETTGKEAMTIHRLLEYSYMEDESMAFGKDEDSRLEADLIIVDEASMIDILLMNSFLKAVDENTRLILVGDTDQLPSVGPGNVLLDIIESGSVELVRLREIFRQSQESMIVVNAHKINSGDYPLLNEKDKDFYFIRSKNPREIGQIITDLASKRLPGFYGFDGIRDIQVLSPMKRGDLGTIELNKLLQETLNPKARGKKEKSMADEVFREGDKVMQIKNNYNIEWTITSPLGKIKTGEGIFNGDMGYITEIDEDFKTLTVVFDDEKEVEYEYNQLDELMLAYATTVHKSQGSEFPVVVMPITWGPPMLLTRNLLYTGITRAKDLVVLVGEEAFLRRMIDNNLISKRYSGLDRKMIVFKNTYIR